jgi:hypothetical protein
VTTVNLLNPFWRAAAVEPAPEGTPGMMVGAYSSWNLGQLTVALPSDIQEGDLLVYREAARDADVGSSMTEAGWVRVAKLDKLVMAYYVVGSDLAPPTTSVASVAMTGNITRYRVPKATPLLAWSSNDTAGPTSVSSTAGVTVPGANTLIVAASFVSALDSTINTNFAAASVSADVPNGTVSTANVEESLPEGRWRAEGRATASRTSNQVALHGFSLFNPAAGATGTFTCTHALSGRTSMIVAAFEFFPAS